MTTIAVVSDSQIILLVLGHAHRGNLVPIVLIPPPRPAFRRMLDEQFMGHMVRATLGAIMTISARHTAETRKPARLGGMPARGAFRGAQAQAAASGKRIIRTLPCANRSTREADQLLRASWVRRPGFRAKPLERSPILPRLPKQSFRSRKLPSLEIAWDRVLELDKDGCIKRKDCALQQRES
jgi:hypothetical protein